MYIPSHELDRGKFYQGDVVKDFPFFVLSNLEDQLSILTNTREGTLEIKSKLIDVMILSQTCDIQRRDQIIIAPIVPMQPSIDNGDLGVNILNNIKNRKINYLFYLPESPGIIPDSYCNFQLIYYVSPLLLNNFINNKITSLSDWGRHHLSWSLSNYFGRPILSK